MNVSPDNITSLAPNEVFTYGANRRGIHGAGAAKQALKWGAIMGQVGFAGQTYGICTKDRRIRTLPLSEISAEIQTFLFYAERHPDLRFLVTAIGTGLAGLGVKDVAPLFTDVPPNVYLPASFWEVLNA